MAVNAQNMRFGPCNVKAYTKEKAEFSTTLTGTNNDFTLRARVGGLAGNDITIALIAPGTASAPLSVVVTGKDIVVNLATSPASAITTTARQLVDALNADFGAAGLVDAVLASGNDGTGVVTALAETSLTGGSDTEVAFDLGALGDETTVTVTNATGDLTAAQLGTDPVDMVVTGGGLTVSVPMKEFSHAHMAFAILNARHIEGADGASRLDFQIRTGERIRATRSTKVVLVPIVGGQETTDPNEILTLPEAGPAGGDVTMSYGNTQREMAAVLRAWPSASGVLGYFGSAVL